MSETEPTDADAGKTPVSIERDGGSAIVITFTDGKVKRWTAAQLRQACPCATCREKKRADEQAEIDAEGEKKKPALLPVLSAAEAKPLTIDGMKPVGQYGYNVLFSDGHSSGIFVFEILYGND